MQRDYKSAGRRTPGRNRRAQPGFSLRSFGYGTLLGAATVLGVQALLPAVRQGAESAVPELRELTRHGKTPPPPPKFEFYTILPEMEVAVPERATSEIAAPPADTDTRYALQVGSFRKPEDADRLRASLLLEDFAATTQTVTIDDATWYRVRVGPFESRRKMDAARARLADRGYRSLMLKLLATDPTAG